MSDTNDKSTSGFGLTHLIVFAIGVFAVWALTGLALYHLFSREEAGQFGDMFGAVNALFSGLAFSCLIVATLMQREELKLQRKELQLARKEAAATREEIRGQREQAVVQNETLKRQQFENTFFECLKLLRDTASSLPSPFDHSRLGPRAFSEMVRIAGQRLFNIQGRSLNDVRMSYNDHRKEIETGVNPFYRTLMGILQLVKISDIQNKQFYASILSSTLSNNELLIVMFYVSSETPQIQLKPLIEEFGLFSNVEIPEHLAAMGEAISPAAFGLA